MKSKTFIRLRRRSRALPVDECEKTFASEGCSPRGKASGKPSADNPQRFDSRSESAWGNNRYHPAKTGRGSILDIHVMGADLRRFVSQCFAFLRRNKTRGLFARNANYSRGE